MGKDFVIDDSTHSGILRPAGFGTGLIPRDFNRTPMRAVQMATIPRSEWSARIKEMKETKSRLSDIWRRGDAGKPILHLDQGPIGYCWGHSTAHAMYAMRAVGNQPFVPLSAFAVCATLVDGRDEGGWGALSLDFITKRGIPNQAFWPQGSRNLSHGTVECWQNAALHKASEQWVDVSAEVWDRDLSFDQVMTCLLLRIPVIADFNWWGHSVCLLDPEEISPGSFGPRLVNSWAGWGDDMGMAVLEGSRAIPDNATALRTVTYSAI